MKRILASVLGFAFGSALVVALFAGQPQAKVEDNPVLIKAEVRTHTNDEDKDHDTGVYVWITSQDGQTELAKTENAFNSGDDGTQFKDNSDHTVPLIVEANAQKSAVQGFNTRIKIHTHGHDTWKFNAQVVLTFSDGTNLMKSKDDIKLVNDGAEVTF